MLSNIKKQRQEGFTIIEVMIVLVIAAVILLIVFNAVPGLQRNSRNTQAKDENSAILAAAAEWSSNNAAAIPSSTSPIPANILLLANAKGITSLNVVACGGTSPTCSTPTAPTGVLSSLVTAAKCTAATPAIPSWGSTRQVALVYSVENQAGPVTACLDSGL